MSNILSSLGLTMGNLDLFGFSGNVATTTFGESNVVNFVEAVFDNALPNGMSWTGADYFTFAQNADEVLQTIPGNDFSYVDYFNQLNADMLQSTGHGLSDLYWSFDGNGNITGGVNGVGESTININDALNNALSNPDVQNALDTANTALGGLGVGFDFTDIFANVDNLDSFISSVAA